MSDLPDDSSAFPEDDSALPDGNPTLPDDMLEWAAQDEPKQGYRLSLKGTPQLSQQGTQVLLDYTVVNEGDDVYHPKDTVVLHQPNGQEVKDDTQYRHTDPGATYDGHFESDLLHESGTYRVRLIVDSDGKGEPSWVGTIDLQGAHG